MSSAFESHMGVFVDAQDKWIIEFPIAWSNIYYCYFRALSDMLAPHRAAAKNKAKQRPSVETTPRTSEDAPEEPNDVPVPVLPSSTELFYFYAQNLEQCAKLSTGKPLYDLCKVHKKWLRIYAGQWSFQPNIFFMLMLWLLLRRRGTCYKKAVNYFYSFMLKLSINNMHPAGLHRLPENPQMHVWIWANWNTLVFSSTLPIIAWLQHWRLVFEDNTNEVRLTWTAGGESPWEGQRGV